MRKSSIIRMTALVASAGCMFQLAGCVGNDFLIRFAGAGAVVSGLSLLLRGN